MIGTFAQLALLGVAAFAVASLIVVLAKRPLALVYAILAAYGWELLAGGTPSVRVIGIGVGPTELVHAVALGVGLLRVRRGPSAWQLALLVALALVVVGTLRGYVMLGDAAMLGFRAELYFLVPAFFVSTLPASAVERVVAGVVKFGAVIAAVAVARWIAVAMGVPWAASFMGSGYAVERVINSGATLAVAFALVVFARRVFVAGPSLRLSLRLLASAVGLAGVVLMAQHRSVWVATLVMLGLLFVRLDGRWHAKAAIVGVVVVSVLMIELSGVGDSGAVAESLAQATTNAGTWEWRLERWDAVWSVHAERGWWAVLFGSGYGHSWVSGEVGVWEASPHNGFLQVAVRLGLAGAVLVFSAYVYVLRKLWTRGGGPDVIVSLWIMGTLVYFIPYAGNAQTGVLLGLALLRARAGDSRAPAWRGSHAAHVDAARLVRSRVGRHVDV